MIRSFLKIFNVVLILLWVKVMLVGVLGEVRKNVCVVEVVICVSGSCIVWLNLMICV